MSHGIYIEHGPSTDENGRERWTVSRYSDERGTAYFIQNAILNGATEEDLELSAIATFDSEAGCFFAYTENRLDAQRVADRVAELLLPPANDRLRIAEQAEIEARMLQAAGELVDGWDYSLQDLIEVLQANEPRDMR